MASGETCWFEYADARSRLPLSMQRGGMRYELGCDHLGSLRAVIDGQGRLVKEVEFDAFGNILKETAPELRIPFGFAGGLHDRDTNMVRYRFRDYLPDAGRFTAKDPIGYKGGDSDLYGYCLDDPVNGIDPSGLISLDATGAAKTGASPGQKKSLKDENQRLQILDPMPSAGEWPESAAHQGLEGEELEQALPRQSGQPGVLELNPEMREDAEFSEQRLTPGGARQDTPAPVLSSSEPDQYVEQQQDTGSPVSESIDLGRNPEVAITLGLEGEELESHLPIHVPLPNDPMGVLARAESLNDSDERDRWDPRNPLESQLNSYGLSMSDATTMGWSHKDIQEYVAFMDHITNLKVDRDANQPFQHIRIADSWDDLPEVIRNFEPQTTWGDIADDMGNHQLNQRLPGGYHVTLERGRNAGVWVHLDAHDQLEPGLSGLANFFRHRHETGNRSIFMNYGRSDDHGHGGMK